MSRKYGNPNSLIRTDLTSENFKISVNSNKLPSFSEVASNLLTSRSAAKQFLRNPTKYLINNGYSEVDSLNITDNNFDVLRVTSDDKLATAVRNRDARSFVAIMIRLGNYPIVLFNVRRWNRKPLGFL